MVSPHNWETNPQFDLHPLQLDLPLAIEDVPSIVRNHGLREAHTYPLVADRSGGWTSTRRPTTDAWKNWPEIELRTPNSFPALILDCDSEPNKYIGVATSGAVKQPNWIVSRGPGGHAHIVYCLARPVLRGVHARPSPLRTLGRVAEFYRSRYNADIGYVGVLTHNPTHPQYAPFTTWNRKRPYTLSELAQPIPYGWRTPPKPTTPEGRNVYLFRYGLKWCGLPRHWQHIDKVAYVLGQANNALDYPLWESELRHIVRSVIKISLRNLNSGQTQRGFSTLQTERGRKSGKSRRNRNAARDAAIVYSVLTGRSKRSTARQFKVSEGTVRWVCNRAQTDSQKHTNDSPPLFSA